MTKVSFWETTVSCFGTSVDSWCSRSFEEILLAFVKMDTICSFSCCEMHYVSTTSCTRFYILLKSRNLTLIWVIVEWGFAWILSTNFSVNILLFVVCHPCRWLVSMSNTMRDGCSMHNSKRIPCIAITPTLFLLSTSIYSTLKFARIKAVHNIFKLKKGHLLV